MKNSLRSTESQPVSQKNNVDGLLELSRLGRRRVQACFAEEDLTSDGGALLLSEVARINGIIGAMCEAIRDERDQAYVRHTLKELLTQRVVQICQGYEDANDCDSLKDDGAIKVAVGRAPDAAGLASQPTMTRLENSIGIRDLVRLFYVFVDNFLGSYETDPEWIVIDMDPTPNRVYGDQQLAFFNAHYDQYCLMPFHVYEGQTGRLIATLVRPGKTPTKEEILSLLKRIVKRIRSRFTDVKILFRADSHHTKPAVLDWLEENDIRYILGMATNKVLSREVSNAVSWVKTVRREELRHCRRFHTFDYAAGSWSRRRRIVARIEATGLGTDSRFIVTDLDGESKFLYEQVYCARAKAELMIKEHKCFLKSSRTSCSSALANQFRLYLHSAAYVVMHGLRASALKGTDLARATFDTIRLRLLKIAARIETGKTYIRFHLPASSPAAPLFARVAAMANALRT